MPQEPRSNGERSEGPLDVRAHAKALRARLVAKYGTNLREYGSRDHAVGHAKRVGYEPASVPMPWDWPVK
jgi:hypothetical protein